MNEKLELLINEVKKAVLGKDDVLKKVVIALLANGHILLEDIPGVGCFNKGNTVRLSAGSINL